MRFASWPDLWSILEKVLWDGRRVCILQCLAECSKDVCLSPFNSYVSFIWGGGQEDLLFGESRVLTPPTSAVLGPIISDFT